MLPRCSWPLAVGVLLAYPVLAQTVTVPRECFVVALPGASETLGTIPASSSLPLRVEDDTDLNYAAVSWEGAAAYVSRSCLSLGFLPPNFTGFRADSLTTLAAKLSASPSAKGEYETTGEYERRLADWRSAVSVDGRTGDSTFVVTVPLGNDEVAYDADRARMTVRLTQQSRLDVVQYLDNFSAPSEGWTYTYFRDASLRNRDARGRLRRASEYTAYLGLAVERYTYRHPLVDVVSFYLPRREAQTVAARLRMALTVRMEPPYLSAGAALDGTGYKTVVGLYTRLEEAVVFDPETGKIYARAEADLPDADVRPGSEDLSSALSDGSAGPYVNACTGLRSPPPAAARTDGPPPEFVAVERQPEKIAGADPDYPPNLRTAGIEGRVVVRTWIGRDGRVKDVQILRSDNDGFNANAIRAVCEWRFTPAVQAGHPVEVWKTIPVRFRQR